MTFSSSHYLTINVPHVHLLPEHRGQINVSLPPQDNPKSENLPEFNFEEFPHHPPETNTPTILNGTISMNSMDLNQESVEARHLVHIYLSTDHGNKTEKCRRTIMHEVQFLTNDQ
jgi:hypothetical protein